MMLIAFFIYLVCAFYIFKTISFMLNPYIYSFYHDNHVSRSESGNDFLSMLTIIIASIIITLFILIMSYLIFRWFSVLVLIGLCLFIRIKDIGNEEM
ncbi:heme/copper-type cytochrome/quinol oxidase subunit 2 [Staphylococcus caprae]